MHAYNTTSYPLIELSSMPYDSKDFNLAVTAYQQGVAYIAISHVWADGLGSTEEKGIPTCHLDHMKELRATARKQADMLRLLPFGLIGC